MGERLSQLKGKTQEALRSPEARQIREIAEQVGGVAVDHVLDEFTREREDGSRKLRKLRVARAALRPVKTARKLAQGAAKASRQEARSVAREHLNGGANEMPIHIEDDDSFWEDDSSTTQQSADLDTPPWSTTPSAETPGDDFWDAQPTSSEAGVPPVGPDTSHRAIERDDFWE